MAASSIPSSSTEVSLFNHLAEIKQRLKIARADLTAIEAALIADGQGEEITQLEWNPALDLSLQLSRGIEDLDEAIDYLEPLDEHVDQLIRLPERSGAAGNC